MWPIPYGLSCQHLRVGGRRVPLPLLALCARPCRAVHGRRAGAAGAKADERYRRRVAAADRELLLGTVAPPGAHNQSDDQSDNHGQHERSTDSADDDNDDEAAVSGRVLIRR